MNLRDNNNNNQYLFESVSMYVKKELQEKLVVAVRVLNRQCWLCHICFPKGGDISDCAEQRFLAAMEMVEMFKMSKELLDVQTNVSFHEEAHEKQLAAIVERWKAIKWCESVFSKHHRGVPENDVHKQLQAVALHVQNLDLLLLGYYRVCSHDFVNNPSHGVYSTNSCPTTTFPNSCSTTFINSCPATITNTAPVNVSTSSVVPKQAVVVVV